MSDRESGLSARTIARRLSSVSGFYAYVVARGDTPVRVNPVPRGSVDPTTGRPGAHGAVGAGAAHAPQDPGAGRSERVVVGAAHRARSGDGPGDVVGWSAPLRGPRPAPGGCAGRGSVVVHRRRQGRPPARRAGREPVLRRARRLPARRTTAETVDGPGVRRVERPAPRAATLGRRCRRDHRRRPPTRGTDARRPATSCATPV